MTQKMNNGITFEEWLIGLGKSHKTAHNYSSAIEGSISQWAIDEGLISQKIDSSITPTEFEELGKKIRLLDRFIAHNKKGNGMYGSALNHYAFYIDDLTGRSVTEDIENVLADSSKTITEKTLLINTRIGQGVYRKNLIEYWKGCAVTGFKNTRLLVASHIKPWRIANNQERLDSNNGILLVPNLDKAFDLGYITFEPPGNIKISKKLETAEILGITEGMHINMSEQHIQYMEYHNKFVFENFEI